jgi:hypothetical protein
MGVPNLPRHVLERAERRWAAVLSRQAALRPASRPPGMQEPSADSRRQPPETRPAEPASKQPIEPGRSNLCLQH